MPVPRSKRRFGELRVCIAYVEEPSSESQHGNIKFDSLIGQIINL